MFFVGFRVCGGERERERERERESVCVSVCVKDGCPSFLSMVGRQVPIDCGGCGGRRVASYREDWSAS